MNIAKNYHIIHRSLVRYRPDWYIKLHLTDVATWLSKFYPEETLKRFYIAAYVESRTETHPARHAAADRLRGAAYLALGNDSIREMASLPGYKAMLRRRVAERRVDLNALMHARGELLKTLWSLLPPHYNTSGD
jgi:hypothetical protein